MIALTRGIVLHKIKYGDSSQIIHIFTEEFGLQSCMIKGLGSGRKTTAKSNLLTPGALLDLSIYYREDKNIKLIKDVHPSVLFENIGQNILKSSITIFAMEVLQNFLTPDDVQTELFSFCCNFLTALDLEKNHKLGNYPLYFLVQSGRHCGYHIFGAYCAETPYLSLYEGRFTKTEAQDILNISPDSVALMAQVNAASDLQTLVQIPLTRNQRQTLLNQFVAFFQQHTPRFRPLKSVNILSVILS